MNRLARSGATIAAAALVATACAPDREGEPEPRIVARVGGEPVYLSDIEGASAHRLYRARLDVHRLLVRELEQHIETQLLEQAARAQGVSTETLLARVMDDATPVSDSDVDRYLAKHPGDAPDASARPRIRHYLEETRRIERRLAFVAKLMEASDIELYLEPPVPARSQLELSGAPSRGPEDAPVTIVHFADLRARDSARSARHLAVLAGDLPERIRIVHRHLPVAHDELGLRTAQLGAAAERRGSFWDFHDRIARAGGVSQIAELETIARASGLGDLVTDIAGDRESLLRVREDIAHAREAGVERAPTLFVNGRYFMGLYGAEALRQLVLEELERP